MEAPGPDRLEFTTTAGHGACPMIDTRSDAELVAAHVGGDRAALAAIYDRYADALHDTAAAMLADRHDAEDLTHDVFVIASSRLDQLRDPTRLKPWLFAVLRHEVYRRTRRRGRERPTDLSVAGATEVTAPTDPFADGADAEREELATFVRAAAAGLAERDQLVLELSVRQGLTGADLADAIGVTPQQCHVLVHRMRERVQRSIGALTVARYGRKDCPQLQALLANWDGSFDPPTRKRIAGHVDQCEVCERTSRRLAVLPLFAAAPAFAAPAALRDRVLASTSGTGPLDAPGPRGYRFDGASGFPRQASNARRMVLVALVAVAVSVLLGGTWLALASGDGAVRTADAAPSTTQSAPPTTAPADQTTTAPALVTDTGTTSPPATTLPATTAPTPPTTTTPTTTAPALVTDAGTATAPPSTNATIAPTTTGLASPAVSPATTAAPPPATTTTTTAPPPATPPPGRLDLSTGVVDLGATAPSGRVRLSNGGGTSLDWAITGDNGPFRLSANTGTLAPGASVDVVVSIDRSPLAEGDISRGVTVTSTASGGASLALRAAVEHAPVVTITRIDSSTLGCPFSQGPLVSVTVADESPVASVVLAWSGPGPAGSAPLREGAGGWTGRVTPAAVDGEWTWEAIATDARGNTGRAGSILIVVGCG